MTLFPDDSTDGRRRGAYDCNESLTTWHQEARQPLVARRSQESGLQNVAQTGAPHAGKAGKAPRRYTGVSGGVWSQREQGGSHRHRGQLSIKFIFILRIVSLTNIYVNGMFFHNNESGFVKGHHYYNKSLKMSHVKTGG